MTAGEAGGPRIAIWPVEAGLQPCARHRMRRADKWAKWRVNVEMPGKLHGKPWGTVSYVCDGCLAPWLGSLILRAVLVEQLPAEQPASKARANGARPRKKARAR